MAFLLNITPHVFMSVAPNRQVRLPIKLPNEPYFKPFGLNRAVTRCPHFKWLKIRVF